MNKFSFKNLFSKIKIEYLIVIGLGIVAIIIFASSFKTEEKPADNVDDYVLSLETKLQKTLSSVSGAGKVKVIISLESGMETVIATEKQTESGKTVEKPVIVNGKTVAIKEAYPEICGVIIVSEGAKNLSVKVALLNATCVYLDVPESKVEILAMK